MAREKGKGSIFKECMMRSGRNYTTKLEAIGHRKHPPRQLTYRHCNHYLWTVKQNSI